MPEALKEVYSDAYIRSVAAKIKEYYPPFDESQLLEWVFDETWPQRELKARMLHITHGLHHCLTQEYSDALQILKASAPFFSGYEAMFFPQYVVEFGRHDWDESMQALHWLTRFSSSEFAVRPFILDQPERMMVQMERWAQDEDEHVRRLASEGCRPRLPWAEALPVFKLDPLPILKVIEPLKADPSLYVRRSVANNLNDIAKDNPAVTLRWAKENIGQCSATDWVIRHGCRTLLKQANPEALALFGFPPQDALQIDQFSLEQTDLKIGETLNFSAQLCNTGEAPLRYRLEYEIAYVKAKGKLQTKIFQIGQGEISPGCHKINGSQSLRQMSTRRHYPGEHTLWIRVNGERKAERKFSLEAEQA